MRKFLIPVIGAVSVLAIAAPAAAQYRPAHNQQPGNGYAYGEHRGRSGGRLEERVQRIRVDIRGLEQRRVVSFREGRSLEAQAAELQRRIYRSSRNGIQPGEGRRLEEDIRRLEYRVSREASDRNNRPGGYRRY
jgi:hypothetical protein